MEFFISLMEKKHYHIVIASIVFAASTWIFVNFKDEYTVVKHVPVVLENMKEGKALKYPIPKNINIRFRGSGWSLVGLYLSPDVKYFIDLSSIVSEDFIITSRDLLEHIKLPFSFQPLEVKPDTLVLALEDYGEKRVPVFTNIMLRYKDGYGQIGSIRVMPESIIIGGSNNLIGPITLLPTVYKKFEDLNTPIDMNIQLEEPMNYSIDLLTKVVQLQIDVQPFAEKTFTGIPITATGTPPNREIIFTPPKMDIIVRGGIQQLIKLTNDDFQASISYQSLIQDSVESIVPQVVVPGEVKIINRTPAEFKFIIRKRL